MRFNYLTLLTALLISSVAIFYSVAGLATIFAASAIPVIIMGTSLEVGKLVAAVWLHKNWHHAVWWLKYYLSAAVIVLMFITSMGIFGYLSKSHVEQTSASLESVAQVDRINAEIGRNNAIITRAETRIKSYEENGSGVDSSIQTQIDREQARISTAYEQVQPQIDTQLQVVADDNTRIEQRAKPYLNEMASIDTELSDLQAAITANHIKKAQGIIGVKPDGSYGTDTAAAVAAFKQTKEKRRKWLLWKVDRIKSEGTSDAVVAARAEMKRVRDAVQEQINESNKLITRLRVRLGTSTESDIEKLIVEQQTKIKVANTELDTLTQDLFKIEAQYRKLEAEVGPVKYIAEFIYGEEANANLLEKAVRWVIVLIIIVFDPLAVLLLIATQYSFERFRTEEEKMQELEAIVSKAEGVMHEVTEAEESLEALVDQIEEPHVESEQPITDESFDELIDDTHDNEADEEISRAIADAANKPTELNRNQNTISLIKVGENYINFNGKAHRTEALILAHPELNLNFTKEVRSGTIFPKTTDVGRMFIYTRTVPTQLYIFNGEAWDKIDKNLLEYSAYSHEYVKALIKLVSNGDYNAELLNEAEKKHIEELLTR